MQCCIPSSELRVLIVNIVVKSGHIGVIKRKKKISIILVKCYFQHNRFKDFRTKLAAWPKLTPNASF